METHTQEALFVLPEPQQTPVPMDAALPPAPPRLRRVDRSQVVWMSGSLEDLLEEDHPARLVWALVETWDLSAFLAAIKARGQTPGRGATDPLILICLWLYAYCNGIGNGRELDRLCKRHDAYRWICGGVSVNYHLLNDFRVSYEKELDDLLTQMLAPLLAEGLVSAKTIANDGTRQRASAGRGSFKTEAAIEKLLQDAAAHVQQMKQQGADPNASMRQQKARERAARQKLQRLQRAREEVQKIQQAKDQQKEKPSKHRQAKASTTDPEARQMHMPDNGNAPAYNVQFAVDTSSRAILAVDVTNAGSDVHQSEPIRQQVEDRTGQKVEQELMDGGFIGLEAVENAAAAGTKVYAPLPKSKEGTDPHAPKKGDGPGVIAWRKQMGTQEAKDLYKQRASTIETANGECKTYRGLTQFLVRGINKVRCIALWSALAYNFVHLARHLVG